MVCVRIRRLSTIISPIADSKVASKLVAGTGAHESVSEILLPACHYPHVNSTMLSDIKSYVIEKIDATEYYKCRFPRWNPRVRSNVSCVFHRGDKKPSLSINLKNGGARCFASSCAKSIGNIVHFESQLREINEADAARNLYAEFIRPIVPVATLQQYQDGINSDPKLRPFFTRATGINSATIEKFQIGYDGRSRRFTFPIQNQWGDVVNVRFYRPKSARKAKDIKIYSLVTGKDTDVELRFGGIEIYPWVSLRSYKPDKPIFFMASEKEAMLANQLNLQAICSTGGEGSWSDEWLELFDGYEVGVLFDPDTGGRKAAEKIVATLQLRNPNVVALELPFASEYKGDKDFDDWIISKNGNQFALVSLLRTTLAAKEAATHPSLSPLETTRDQIAGDWWDVPKMFDEDIHDLSEIRTRTDLLNHCVRTRGIIAAVATKSFDVPYKFKIKTKNGVIEYNLPVGRDLISFVGSSDADLVSTLSRLVGTDVKEWKAEAYVPIAEVEVVPIADVATENEGRYTVQRCYVSGETY